MMKSLLLFNLERQIIKKYLEISQSKDPMKLDKVFHYIIHSNWNIKDFIILIYIIIFQWILSKHLKRILIVALNILSMASI